MTNQTKTNVITNHHATTSRGQRSIVSYALLLIVFAFLAPTAFAQLKVYPLPRTAESFTAKSKKKNSTARTQELTPRSLPFWDDFSWTAVNNKGDTVKNYPVDSLWVNNYRVWVNDGLGLNPPSINVASLNGLDSADNSPYSDQSTATGFRDTLVSQPIKLNEVVSGERSSVYLSFFYQWSGNGEPPDANDYLRVDFKNDQGTWESVMTIRTKDSFQNDEFYDTIVQVNGDRFFHENFQFRFMNFGRLSGPYDTWNLDYVYLNKNRTSTDRYLPDRTIISSLTNLFNQYRAVPYDHFLVSKSISQPAYGVFNVKNDTSTLSYSTQGIFHNYKDGVAVPYEVDTLGNSGTSPIDGLTGIIYARERKTVTLEHVPDPNDVLQFDPDADSVSVSLKVQLFTGDTFNPKTGAFASDYNPLKYQPLDFRSNDTIRADYWLKDYYAYDDGIADYAVALTAFGNRAAYLFEMLTPEPDTLVGFDIYYPDYGVPSNLNVDFTVYDDANGLPGTPLYTLPSYSIARNGTNKFKKIRFGEPFLVEDKFYVGWKAPVGGAFKVGLDTNNDSGPKLFVNTNGFWFQSADVIGSVMIRPVFGSGTIITGIPEEELQSQIFPNPNDGGFFVPRDFKIITITNLAGQSVEYTIQGFGESQKVNVPNASAGLYILRMQKNEQIFSSKVVIR